MRVLILMLLLSTPALAAGRLTVVELFTSQGCSSCPPADALLTDLAARDPDILALDFHITYWDRLGWKDPYSLNEATARQRNYAANLGLDTIYTPQMVVGGRREMVGSDRIAVQAAVQAARTDAAVPLTVANDAAGLRIDAGTGPGGGIVRGTIILVGYDRQHDTAIRAGENGGRTLHEVNVVRAVTTAGPWTGTVTTLTTARPAGERVAAILQAPDGKILGAAILNQ